jgi:hypothetical protein
MQYVATLSAFALAVTAAAPARQEGTVDTPNPDSEVSVPLGSGRDHLIESRI